MSARTSCHAQPCHVNELFIFSGASISPMPSQYHHHPLSTNVTENCKKKHVKRKKNKRKQTNLVPVLIQTQRAAGVLDKQVQQPHLVGAQLGQLAEHRVGDEVGAAGAGGEGELLLVPHFSVLLLVGLGVTVVVVVVVGWVFDSGLGWW